MKGLDLDDGIRAWGGGNMTQHQLNRWVPFEHLARAAKHDESRRMLEAKRAITNGCGASR